MFIFQKFAQTRPIASRSVALDAVFSPDLAGDIQSKLNEAKDFAFKAHSLEKGGYVVSFLSGLITIRNARGSGNTLIFHLNENDEIVKKSVFGASMERDIKKRDAFILKVLKDLCDAGILSDSALKLVPQIPDIQTRN